MGSESYKYPRRVHPLREGLKNIPVGGPFVLNWLTRPTFSLYIFSRIRSLTESLRSSHQLFNRSTVYHFRIHRFRSGNHEEIWLEKPAGFNFGTICYAIERTNVELGALWRVDPVNLLFFNSGIFQL
jgi:hypothetical protein